MTRGRSIAGLAVVAAPVLVSFALVGGALLEATSVSLHPGIGGPYSTEAWTRLRDDPAFRDSLHFTLLVSVASTLVAVTLGVILYLCVRRSLQRATTTALLMPLVIPHLVAAVIVVAWVAPGGIAERVLGAAVPGVYRDRHGLGIVAAYAWKETAFVLALLLAVPGSELHEREEMARSSGLGSFARLRHVTLPGIARPMIVAGVAVMTFAIGALEIPSIIGPTYPRTLAQYSVDAVRVDLISGRSAAAASALVTTLCAVATASTIAGLVALRACVRRMRQVGAAWA